MSEVIVFADAVATAVGYLSQELAARDDDTPVVSKVPNPRPDAFVRVQRTGGTSRSVVIDDPFLTIESWATTEEAAHDRAQLCRGILHAATGSTFDGVTFYRVTETAGPGFIPDPLSGAPRYSQTLLVALRGAAEPTGS